ncbi:hypothetical protein MBANPS3_005080 [Mucor bainieri]
MTTYNRFVAKYQEENQEEHAFVCSLPSLKTVNIDRFVVAATARIDAYDRLKSYYNYVTPWSLQLYRKKQIYIEEIVKQFIGSSKKYSSNTSKNIPSSITEHYHHPNPNDNPDDEIAPKTIIAYGGAKFSTPIGCRSSPSKRIWNALYQKAIQSNGKIQFFFINEHHHVCSEILFKLSHTYQEESAGTTN